MRTPRSKEFIAGMRHAFFLENSLRPKWTRRDREIKRSVTNQFYGKKRKS